MKELSIEEKAKRYDEAFKEASVAHKDEDRHLKATLERIFPELTESDDERIRKEIIAFLTYYHTGQGNSVKYDDDWIAWLEKQGEQKLTIEKLPSEMKTIGESLGFTTQEECDRYNQMVSDLIMSDDKDEQKPAENSCKNSDGIITEEKDRTEYKKGFECGKQRVLKYPEDFGLCKKPAWSEEDENIRQWIISDIDKLPALKKKSSIIADKEINWLKSLRPQSTWKPSGEQMLVMESIKNYFAFSKQSYREIFTSLYEQLKAL